MSEHDPETKRTRVGAYALCFDARERVLLCRMSTSTRTPGVWTLPGGGLRHGEPPDAAVLRELAEETGLVGTVRQLLGVHDSVYEIDGSSIHGIRLLYLVAVDTAAPRAEPAGGTDGVRWFSASDLTDLDLSAHARSALESDVSR